MIYFLCLNRKCPLLMMLFCAVSSVALGCTNSLYLAHVCVILDDGSLKCYGGNGQGQLGQGNTNAVASSGVAALTAVSLAAAATVTAAAVAVGGGHTCVSSVMIEEDPFVMGLVGEQPSADRLSTDKLRSHNRSSWPTPPQAVDHSLAGKHSHV